MPRIEVSIIVRTFNEARHIRRCLEGILSQRVSFPFEIILVDSGSTDGTLDVVEKFDVKVVKINPEEFTFGRSLNRGIEQASGEFCVMISAHGYPANESWLENLLHPFGNDKVALVYGKQRGNHVTRYSEQQIFARWFPDESTLEQRVPFCNNANAAIRRALWHERKFDESLTGMEDIEWAKYMLSRGFILAYVSDACIFHVHEESYRQVYRRYEREALAIRSIYPGASFSLLDFVKLFTLNVVGDLAHALSDGVLLKYAKSILVFRFLQFLATHTAHRITKPISKELRYKLYYPRNFVRSAVLNLRNGQNRTIRSRVIYDISRPLRGSLPAWPGAKRFDLQWIKTIRNHGCNESHISMNTHTGTHIDAPFHFVECGKRVQDLDLSRMIGEAYVVECLDNGAIDIDVLNAADIPRTCVRLLLKTSNSLKHRNASMFDERFVALKPCAAQWIVERGIVLIGIDACSIQLFDEKTNETHKILLEAGVVILEGLDLAAVRPGRYELVALPLSIPEAEGAPVRAVVMREGDL